MKTPQKGIHNDKRENSTPIDQVAESRIFCPICEAGELGTMENLQIHVEGHFRDNQYETNDPNNEHKDELLAIRLQKKENFERYKQSKEVAENLHFEDLQDKYGMTSSGKKFQYSSGIFRRLQNDVGKSISPFDFYSKQIEILEKLEKGIDDGLSTSGNTFHQLATYLQQTLRGNQRAYLSSPVDFIGRGAGDAGWGCGYRNIQMLVSSLPKHPAFSDVAQNEFKGNIPSIPKIQETIEKAWNEGYDVQGSIQLQTKLRNTRKWIGATEAFTFFAHMKLHCRIVDFDVSASQPNHSLLLQWVMGYFEIPHGSNLSKSTVTVTEKLPLYLQHDGHSRTIVGLVTCMDNACVKVNKLVIFDPGIHPAALWKKNKPKNNTTLRGDQSEFCAEKLLKPVSDLRKRQYQIVTVVGHASKDRIAQQKDVDAVCEKIK